MSVADFSAGLFEGSLTGAELRRQYERFPYPTRDPQSAAAEPSDLDDLEALNHYGFRGRRDFARGFRVLVAGAGTGDSTLQLAEQLAGTDATIVHVDLSGSAIEVARRRAERRDLADRIAFLHGSLLDLPSAGLGRFDYIRCAGEFSRLDDPLRGLVDLRSVLADDGVIGLSVEGRHGRTGVTQARELIHLACGDEDELPECLENTRDLFSSLPASNWMRRVPNHLPPVEEMDDAEIVDMFLSPQDRTFSVPELYELVDAAGLHLVEFARTYRLLYRPLLAIHNKRLRRRIAQLPLRRQQAVAELLWGIVPTHRVWVAASPDTMADPRDAESVPFVPESAREAGLLEAAADPATDSLKLRSPVPGAQRLSLRIPLNDAARRFLALVDGRRTMGQIAAAMGTEDAWSVCVETFEALRAQDALLLRQKPA